MQSMFGWGMDAGSKRHKIFGVKVLLVPSLFKIFDKLVD